MTSVKEQMAGTYAEKLAEKGFIAFAFDYRNYGESEGQPRQYEDPALKLRDQESAVTYLLSLPYVKAVGALGVCTSGGNMAYLAADDKRVKAVAIAAAHLSDPSNVSSFYASIGKNVDSLRKAGAEARKNLKARVRIQLFLLTAIQTKKHHMLVLWNITWIKQEVAASKNGRMNFQ